jgi:hypothetical protein
MILHERLSKNAPGAARWGEGFIRFHLWARGERRKGGDARARQGKGPRRMRKDRGVEAQVTRHTGHPQELWLLDNKAVELDSEDPGRVPFGGRRIPSKRAGKQNSP